MPTCRPAKVCRWPDLAPSRDLTQRQALQRQESNDHPRPQRARSRATSQRRPRRHRGTGRDLLSRCQPRPPGGLSTQRTLGRLGRARRQGLAPSHREALRPGAHHLLQLRVGLWTAGLHRSGNGSHSEVRGQSRASRIPRPQLRQGTGHAESDHRSGPHPLSPQAAGQARSRAVDAGFLGRGPGRHRRSDSQSAGRRAAQRNHVPRGTTR